MLVDYTEIGGLGEGHKWNKPFEKTIKIERGTTKTNLKR